MYSIAAWKTAHQRLYSAKGPCLCQHCVHHGVPHEGGPSGYRHAPPQTNHPSLHHRRDVQPLCLTDRGGGRAYGTERAERSCHRNPQRKPVFPGPVLCAQPDDLSRTGPWDFNPAGWSCPMEPGERHYPSVREQCGCVAWPDGLAGARPLDTDRSQPPLPQAQFRGHSRHRRAVRYISVEEEEEEEEEGEEEEKWEGESWGRNGECCHCESQAPGYGVGHLATPNGHCGPTPVHFLGGEGPDKHCDGGQLKGGSEEGCNGAASKGPALKAFFSTEVPPKNFNSARRRAHCVSANGSQSEEPATTFPTTSSANNRDLAALRQQGKEDRVREQIRQVVTNLEDVLGGLKQVHVEMKEVVEQIDRLTANIDLGDGAPRITQVETGSQGNTSNSAGHTGALVPNHRPAAPVQGSHIPDGDQHVVLSTNSPSPVNMASVVKTNRVVASQRAPSKQRDLEKRCGNGYLPHLQPLSERSTNVGLCRSETVPPSWSLDPTVIVWNSTTILRTQKPPPYPHNGRGERAGKGSVQPPEPLKAPPYPGRGKQSSSIV